MTKRRIELSLLNVLFCLTVIMIHILSYPVSQLDMGTAEYTAVMLLWRLMSFVVQGFVLLSGLKMFLTKKDTVGYFKYILGRIITVIVPYIICCVAYNLFFRYQYGYSFEGVEFWSKVATGHMVSHLYFIPLLLQFDLLYPLWKIIVGKCTPIIVVPTAVVLSCIFESKFPAMINAFTDGAFPIYNDRIFTTYLSFWLVGCYIGKYYDTFRETAKKHFATVSVIYGTSTVLCAFLSYYHYNGLASVPAMNEVHYIYTFGAIIFLLCLAIKLPENTVAHFPLLRVIDRLSYGIYLWHMMLLYTADVIISDLAIKGQWQSFGLRAVFVYGGTILVLFALSTVKRQISERVKALKTKTA
ncbi:MAG: acyltransferase [Clostridia bacterium]|nr:acyltransferase [Clostridia bacterium]